jgi:hypothetical protein
MGCCSGGQPLQEGERQGAEIPAQKRPEFHRIACVGWTNDPDEFSFFADGQMETDVAEYDLFVGGMKR